MPKLPLISVVTGASPSRHLCAVLGSCWTACTKENISLCPPFPLHGSEQCGRIPIHLINKKEVIQYRLQKLKPDNKRCYMDKWKDCRAQQDPCSVFNRNCGQIIDTKHSLSWRLWSQGLEKTEETCEFFQACQTFGRHTSKSNKNLF